MKFRISLRSLVLILILFSMISVNAADNDRQTVSIKMQNTPVRTAIDKLSQLYQTDILYADAILEDYHVTCDISGVTLEEAMSEILIDVPIAFKRTRENQIVLYSQENFNTKDVSGYVVDARSGEALPYVNIQILNSRIGTSSNQYGQFSLPRIPLEEATLKAEYVGYKASLHSLNAKNLSPHLIIELEEYTQSTEAVVVEAFDWDIVSSGENIGQSALAPEYFMELPSVWSQDLMRSLQLMPGIHANTNGTSGLNIRGSSAAENLVTLDGMSLYHIDHVFGLLSTVNPRMIKDVRVHKSGFAAKYGGRTAGFVELTGKTGNMSNVTVETGLSELEFNGLVEVPIFGRGSLLLSGRRSMLTDQALDFYNRLLENPPFKDDFPQIQRPGSMESGPSSTGILFYDTYAKLTFIPGKNDVLNISGYLSKDEITDEFGQLNPADRKNIGWGNRGISIRWHRSWSEELYSTILISESKYEVDETLPTDSTLLSAGRYSQSDIDNSVEDFNIKMDNQWKLRWNHDIHAGFHFSRFTTDFNESVADHDNILVHGATGENVSFYLQDKWQIHPRAHIMAGLRATHFVTTLNSDSELFWNPRFSAEYNVFGNWSLKAAWGKYRQYILNFGNQFANFEGRLTWMIADNIFLKPAESTHNVLGIKWENSHFLFDLEFYRKDLSGLVEQVNSIQVENGVPKIITSLVQRDGEAQGADVLMARKRGTFTGWISYSYNETELSVRQSTIRYPGTADIPHNLNVVGNYRYRSFTFSAVWNYSSGTPYTVPDVYETDDPNDAIHFLTAPVERYTQRLPDRQRLDLSAFYNLNHRSFQSRVGLSLYNVLDRKNIWYRHFSIQNDRLSENNVYMPGFTPTFVFELAFR